MMRETSGSVALKILYVVGEYLASARLYAKQGGAVKVARSAV